MKRRFGFWTVVLIGCLVAGSADVAGAQISVAVTSSVAITVSPGATISNAGAFSVTNSSGATITISAVNLSATNPGIFTSLTLTGQVPGTSAVAVQSNPNPPGTSNTFNFAALPALLNGQTATFSLSGVAATSLPTPTPAAGFVEPGANRVAYAGIMWPLVAEVKIPAGLLAATALGLLLMTGNLRRRHLFLLAIAIVMAATEVGCGNTTSNVSGTSTQQVQTITASSGGAPTGLPATLGSITVQ